MRVLRRCPPNGDVRMQPLIHRILFKKNFPTIVEETTSVNYLTLFQDMAPPAIMYKYLDVNWLLFWHLAKSELEYPMISNLFDL